MDVKIMRSELMKFSKEELITELLAVLIELAKNQPPPPRGTRYLPANNYRIGQIAAINRHQQR